MGHPPPEEKANGSSGPDDEQVTNLYCSIFPLPLPCHPRTRRGATHLLLLLAVRVPSCRCRAAWTWPIQPWPVGVFTMVHATPKANRVLLNAARLLSMNLKNVGGGGLIVELTKAWKTVWFAGHIFLAFIASPIPRSAMPAKLFSGLELDNQADKFLYGDYCRRKTGTQWNQGSS